MISVEQKRKLQVPANSTMINFAYKISKYMMNCHRNWQIFSEQNQININQSYSRIKYMAMKRVRLIHINQTTN